MQVALNGDDEYQGGQLVFATGPDGILVPARPRGSATIHTHSIVHGVTALTGGTRHGVSGRPYESQSKEYKPDTE